MGIIDLIALLASIANDASQTSSQADDGEKLDLHYALCKQTAHKCKSKCILFKLWLALVGESAQMDGCRNYML